MTYLIVDQKEQKVTRNNLNLFAIIILAALTMINLAPTAGAEECAENPVLFVADVSGSMRCESPAVQTTFTSGIEDDGKNEKIELGQELLYRLVPSVAARQCQTGIFLMRYLPGDPNFYSVFMGINSHGPNNIKKKLTDEFDTHFPVFNRRTPLADTLRYIDKYLWEPVSGKMTLVIISDGRDSFYNIEKDMARTETEDNDKTMGPVSEVKRLMQKYGDNLEIHTVYVPGQNDESGETGKNVLEMMASAGQGGNSTAIELLEEDLHLMKFTGKLCCE